MVAEDAETAELSLVTTMENGAQSRDGSLYILYRMKFSH